MRFSKNSSQHSLCDVVLLLGNMTSRVCAEYVNELDAGVSGDPHRSRAEGYVTYVMRARDDDISVHSTASNSALCCIIFKAVGALFHIVAF